MSWWCDVLSDLVTTAALTKIQFSVFKLMLLLVMRSATFALKQTFPGRTSKTVFLHTLIVLGARLSLYISLQVKVVELLTRITQKFLPASWSIFVKKHLMRAHEQLA